MLRIYIARHGQDQDHASGVLAGRRNPALIPLGVQQMGKLAREIKDAEISFDAVYTSPLERAVQATDVLSQTITLPQPSLALDLQERELGVMTGKPVTSIEQLCAPALLKNGHAVYFLTAEGAEAFPDLMERGRQVLDVVRRDHPDGNVLLMTHGAVGKIIYAAYYKLDWQSVMENFHFGKADLLLLGDGLPPEKAQVFRKGALV